MTSAEQFYAWLQGINAAAFLLVGLLATAGWLRSRERLRGYLAGSCIALACFAVLRQVGPLLPPNVRVWLRIPGLLFFLGSAAGLLMVRHRFVPLPRWAQVGIPLVGASMLVTFAVIGIPPLAPASCTASVVVRATALQNVVLGLTVALWTVCVLEPAYRLWRVAGPLAEVQRGRLRFLSTGYVAIVAVVLVTFGAARGCGSPGVVEYFLQLAELLIIPTLSASLSPPGWVRRYWRQHAEDALRGAIKELLLDTRDRVTLAKRSLDWAIRLVGGEAGVIADSADVVLARAGPSTDDAVALIPTTMASGRATVATVGSGGDQRLAILQPLSLAHGQGALIVISGHLSPLFQSDEVERLAEYASSITAALDRVGLLERAMLKELELRDALDLAEGASRAKSEFLSRMSHELRTPLTAILGFAELLGFDGLTPRQGEYVDTIGRAGDHLLSLINDVLDIASIEAGRLVLTPESVDLNGVVEQVVELAAPMIQGRGITSRIAVESGVYVAADPQRLEQVVLNLVSNAVKYNREGGAIDIASSAAGASSVRLTVADTGAGLTAEEIVRLFSPFERLTAANGSVDGTGLGLAVSRVLAEAMGGSMGVESIAGTGSTFWVELPRSEPPMMPAGHGTTRHPVVRPRHYRKSCRILYVEDTDSNQRLLTGIMSRRTNVTLHTAEGGVAALNLAHEHRPDLTLLDLHLPDMDGAAVLTQLREDESLRDMPIIILSADATAGQRSRLIELGATEYVTKPIRVREILEVMDRYLGPTDDPKAEVP